MTSMLLTERSAPLASGRVARCSAALSALKSCRLRLVAAVARRDVLLLGVFQCRFLVHRIEQIVMRLDPVGGELPMLAVPLLDADEPVAAMVLARELDRRDQPLGAKLGDAGGGDVEILEAPADLLAGQR